MLSIYHPVVTLQACCRHAHQGTAEHRNLMMLGCMHALLLATATTAELKGTTNNAELQLHHAAPPQPAASSPATPPVGEPASSPASLPVEMILQSAERGARQNEMILQWLRKGGPVDTLWSDEVEGQLSTFSLLQMAVTNGHLETTRALLKQGASVDLQSDHGSTALMAAAYHGHLSILLLLLQHSADPDLQDTKGQTALMFAASQGHEACVRALLQHSANPDQQNINGFTALMAAAYAGQEACAQALLRATANTELLDKRGLTALQYAEAQGHTAIVELIRSRPIYIDLYENLTASREDELLLQHAAPPQPAASSPPAGEPASSPASLPAEILQSAERGEVQKVAKWLRKGGPVDALGAAQAEDGQFTTSSLLHAAATNGHLEMARELLKRGASVDLQRERGSTALMGAASYGHLSILLLLMQHSADPDLQDTKGRTALMAAAHRGQEACVRALLQHSANPDLQQSEKGGTALMIAASVGQEACAQALLIAKANTELLDNNGDSALQLAEAKGHTAIAKLFRQHASCLSFGLGAPLCALAVRLTWPWVVLSVVLGAIATLAFSRTLTAGTGRHRAARQRWPHRPARHTRDQGRTNTAAPPQPAAAVAPHVVQAEQVARADAAMKEPLAEEAAEQAKGQARPKKSKKKNKAGHAAATGNESNEALPAAAPAPPPTAASKPAESAAERAGAALRGAIASGGLSALEAALAAAPGEVREGGVGAEARAQCDRLLEAQQEAEAEAARLAAAEQVLEVAAREVVRVAAASKARAVAKAAAAAVAAAIEAAAIAEAEADALERATAGGGGEGDSSGAAGPSEAREAAIPDQYMCSITAEIMTDPVFTVHLPALYRQPCGVSCIFHTLPSRPHHSSEPILCDFFRAQDHTNANRQTASPTSAAPSSCGSRPTTLHRQRASSWRASSLNLTTLSAASSETSMRPACSERGAANATCGPTVGNRSFSQALAVRPDSNPTPVHPLPRSSLTLIKYKNLNC